MHNAPVTITDPLAPLSELDGVAEAVQGSRSAVDALLANRVLRQRSAEVGAESVLHGAWASAVLDGSTVTVAQLRDGSDVDPISQGALRVSAELASLAKNFALAHRQALARLHTLAATDLVLPADLGRPRADREVAHRLDLLADVLGRTSAPAVVIAAVVQGEILSLDAFAPVSGVVARAAARLVLIQRGLDPTALVALEVGHLQLRSEMDSALRGYAEDGAAGVGAWIVHCCKAVALGAREGQAICESLTP
jgi:hypothetical protein